MYSRKNIYTLILTEDVVAAAAGETARRHHQRRRAAATPQLNRAPGQLPAQVYTNDYTGTPTAPAVSAGAAINAVTVINAVTAAAGYHLCDGGIRLLRE